MLRSASKLKSGRSLGAPLCEPARHFLRIVKLVRHFACAIWGGYRVWILRVSFIDQAQRLGVIRLEGRELSGIHDY